MKFTTGTRYARKVETPQVGRPEEIGRWGRDRRDIKLNLVIVLFEPQMRYNRDKIICVWGEEVVE